MLPPKLLYRITLRQGEALKFFYMCGRSPDHAMCTRARARAWFEEKGLDYVAFARANLEACPRESPLESPFRTQ